MKTTRREFVKTSAGLAGTAAIAAVELGAGEAARSPARRLAWRADSVAPDFQPMLRILGEEHPLREIQAGAPRAGEILLRIERAANMDGYSIQRRAGEATVRCATLSCAGRALGTLLAGLVDEGATSEDRPAFTTLGIVLDCGHNATVRPAHLRKWLRRLALLGYDAALVYTEAGYQLPGEPCFGYMRGNYQANDLKALDQYAAQLGIEMMGAIQALGHLEQVLKWPPYAGLRDTEHVLLAGEPRTYELIEKMVAHWAGVFRSRRFHLGMDETYDLGRGRYLDRHGFRRGLDIYSEHLTRVAAICARHGLRPMIWSDVLFKLAKVSGGHYDKDSRVPAEIAAALPKNLDLVYWDYYSADKKRYLDRIRSHRDLGSEPVMASGVWSWPNFWHHWSNTEKFAGACVDGCREAGLKQMLFTLWSDDGAFWELDSSFAGLTYAAEKCFGDGSVSEEKLARRFRAVCFSDLAVHRTASRINEPLQSCSVMWDDPLLAMYLRKVARGKGPTLRDAEKHYLEVARALEPHRRDHAAGDLGHAWLVARAHAAKVGIAARLFDAYEAKDRRALATVRAEIPPAIALIEEVARSFRTLWLARCEPFGLEVLQIRFAGLAARYRELAQRLGEFLEGKIPSIAELDEGAKGAYTPLSSLAYRSLATGSRVF